MIEAMIDFIYNLPIPIVIAIIIESVLLWIILGKILKSAWKIINIILTIIFFIVILLQTVIGRPFTDNHEIVFFNTYGPDFYREMLMNFFLFCPFGLSLSVLIGPWSVLTGCVLSLAIEAWQFVTGSGLAQGTDVIMNTLGCAVGLIPWFVLRKKE